MRLGLSIKCQPLAFCEGKPYCNVKLNIILLLRVWTTFYHTDTTKIYRQFHQSEDYRPVFHRLLLLRGLERTCVMCVKGCPVERQPDSSVPAPCLYHSLSLCCPSLLLLSPFCHFPPLSFTVSLWLSVTVLFPIPVFSLTRRRINTLYDPSPTPVQTYTQTVCLSASLNLSLPTFLPLLLHPQSIIQMSNAFSLL